MDADVSRPGPLDSPCRESRADAPPRERHSIRTCPPSATGTSRPSGAAWTRPRLLVPLRRDPPGPGRRRAGPRPPRRPGRSAARRPPARPRGKRPLVLRPGPLPARVARPARGGLNFRSCARDPPISAGTFRTGPPASTTRGDDRLRSPRDVRRRRAGRRARGDRRLAGRQRPPEVARREPNNVPRRGRDDLGPLRPGGGRPKPEGGPSPVYTATFLRGLRRRPGSSCGVTRRRRPVSTLPGCGRPGPSSTSTTP